MKRGEIKKENPLNILRISNLENLKIEIRQFFLQLISYIIFIKKN